MKRKGSERPVRILRVGEPRDSPRTLVLYDVEEDRTRNRVVNICKDYGLERIQYSVFLGRLNRNRRQALCKRLQVELESSVARVRVQPICEKDAAEVWILDQFAGASEEDIRARKDAETIGSRRGR